MTPADRYHMWVQWSEEDGVFLGHCPDLITGIHGEDPVRLYNELRDLVNEIIGDMAAAGEPLPEPATRPMRPAEDPFERGGAAKLARRAAAPVTAKAA